MMPMPVTDRNADRKTARVCLHLTQACQHHQQHTWNKEFFHILPLSFLRFSACSAHSERWTHPLFAYSSTDTTYCDQAKSNNLVRERIKIPSLNPGTQYCSDAHQ